MKYIGKEIFFSQDQLIVSKTDLAGRITYANDVFLDIAGYKLGEIVGKPHNIIRHPAMPKSVFRLLWERLKKGKEIFAYVVNSTKNGDYYWVLAHVTPSFADGQMIGFHSTRRQPNREVISAQVEPLYKQLVQIERSAKTAKAGEQEAYDTLLKMLGDKNLHYNEFMAKLIKGEAKNV